MSKNITLNGNTYNEVSAIQIGTVKFIEESEASISKQTFTIDQDYTTSSVNGPQWLIETYFGSTTNGIYIAKTLNNTGFADSNKEAYALEYLVLTKHDNKWGGVMWRTNGKSVHIQTLSNVDVTYLAQGATLKTVKISEEAVV